MIYRFVRAIWRAALFGFFRRIDVQGRANVPAVGPTLIVSNHANAFIDGLLFVTELERPVTLTAKSTLRKNPLLRPVMRALGVIELQRVQDAGVGGARVQNTDALAACRDVLSAGGTLVIFPEGVSHSEPSIRPFRTGAARIALDYDDERDGGEPLRVVPAGLHFEAKERFRSQAGIVFGAPLDLTAWRAEHPAAGARELTAEMEARIRAVTANYATDRDIRKVESAARLLEGANAPPPALGRETPPDLAAHAALVRRLQVGQAWLAGERAAELQSLEMRLEKFMGEMDRLGITVPELFMRLDRPSAAFFLFRELELLVVGSTVAAWGTINHIFPYSLVRILVRNVSTDRDHFASNAVFMGTPVFLLFYLLQTAAVAWLASPWWAALYAVSLPYSGAVAVLYQDRAGGARRRARTFLLFRRDPEGHQILMTEARSILADFHRLAAEYEAATR
ncbi:MAG: lysophospholipid acyltransferase family protein [Gemmatimonadetes bacterium]|nr:lysophospholipid acyltransferase family protein [Gemmatimonadota bacterium]